MATASTSAFITKGHSTTTSHWITPCCSFYPKIAFGALFELGANSEVLKFLVIFAKSIANSVLSARHSSMVNTTTIQTIMLWASWASIIIESSIMSKNSGASSSWTPRSIFIQIFFYIKIKTELVIFFFKIPINKLLNIWQIQKRTTSRRTRNINFLLTNQSLYIPPQAFLMEHMTTSQCTDLRIVNLFWADFTHDLSIFRLSF